MKTKKSKRTATSTLRKRKSKYINVQKHIASCGPVAIANAIKWFGIETSYESVLRFCLGLRAYHKRYGMWPYQMRYVLRSLHMRFRVRKKFTIDDLDVLLNSGGSLILVYDTPRGGHAVFIDSKLPDGYRSWNRGKGRPPFFSREDMEKAIQLSTRKDGNLYAYTFQRVIRAKLLQK